MYWSMLESGVGFCAACLPSIYTIVAARGIQSIVRSVRSLVSLRSQTSTRSHKSNATKHTQTTPDATSNHDWTKLPDDKTATLSSSAASPNHEGRMNRDDIELESLPEEDQIKVLRTFDMVEDSV